MRLHLRLKYNLMIYVASWLSLLLLFEATFPRQSNAEEQFNMGDSGRPEVYDLETRFHIVVRITDTTCVAWRDAAGNHSQQLVFPQIKAADVDTEFPTVWWPSEDLPTKHDPTVIIWPRSSTPTIVVVAENMNGDKDARAPIVYQLRGENWHRISPQPESMAFVERGCFFVSGRTMYIWDFVDDEGYGYSQPQRYWLKEYRLGDGRLSLVSVRTTKHRYAGDWGTSGPVPEKADPLREFGLKWRWWGD